MTDILIDMARPRDVPRIHREIAQDDLTLVIAGATQENDKASIGFILDNISKRMAEGLRDDAAERAQTKPEEVEAAMMRIVSTIRTLEAAGEIYLLTGED